MICASISPIIFTYQNDIKPDLLFLQKMWSSKKLMVTVDSLHGWKRQLATNTADASFTRTDPSQAAESADSLCGLRALYFFTRLLFYLPEQFVLSSFIPMFIKCNRSFGHPVLSESASRYGKAFFPARFDERGPEMAAAFALSETPTV